MNRKFVRLLAARSLCLAAAVAAMQVANAETTFKIGGFGTLGLARSSLEGTEFRTNLNQFEGVDNDGYNFGVDTRLGLQGTVSFSGDVSLTAQLLAARREDEDLDTQFEWLFAQYKGIPGLDVKVGRVALPAFLVSDSRFVGYATPWLRVPPLVYSMMPLSTTDGMQIGYSHEIGSAIASIQVTQGYAKGALQVTNQPIVGVPFYIPLQMDFRGHVTGINGAIEMGDWTVRLGQVRNDTQLTPRLTGADQPLVDTFREVGLQYDNGTMVLAAEYVTRKTEPGTADGKGWYVAGGYRFGTVMPYLVVSKLTPKDEESANGVAGGVRYDFAKNVALKLEYARYGTNSFYMFTDSISSAALGKKSKVFSVALDFVF